MNKKKIFRPVLLALAVLALQSGRAQVTTANNSPASGDYVGCDGLTTFPLEVRHNGPYQIDWYTDSIQRMRLSPTLTSQNWAWYNANNLDLSGHLGIGNPVPQRPLTYLHLNSSALNGITVGYRPWMRVGVFSTQGSDGQYSGMRALNGVTEAVLNWSDDDGAMNQMDPLCFVFTSTPDSSSTASTYAGLEVARMAPAANGNEGFLGVGDWRSAAAVPNERVDLLDRTIRLRRIIPDYNNDTLTRVVMVDSTGRLHWRRLSTWPSSGGGGTGCEWTMNVGSPNHVYTAVGAANASCPDDLENVGIGNSAPVAKLDIRRNPVSGTGNETGLQVYTYGNDQGGANTGVISILRRASGAAAANEHTGTLSISYDGANLNYGVFGRAYTQSGQTTATSIGVKGDCNLNTGSTVASSYGVYGYTSGKVSSRAYGVYGFAYTIPADTTPTTPRYAGVYGGVQHPNVANRWAAYFEGKGFLSSGPWVYSDAGLKQDIEPLDDALSLLNQLEPKKYRFRVDEHPTMALPDGHQMGLLAQDVEDLLPGVVVNVDRPADVDSAGLVLEEAMSFKAINYTALIPLVIGAVKQQQAMITEQQEQISQLQSQLAACCAAPSDGGTRNLSAPLDEGDATSAQERLLRIAPNPFTDRTTLYYNLERAGRAQLLVNSADGRDLRVLSEAQREAGEYQYEWDTTGLAPGMYYVTLLLDGEPMVKRAVKVQR